MRGVLKNDTTTRDQIPLNGFGVTKGESGSVSIIIKIGMEMSEYYTYFNYIPTIPHTCVKLKDKSVAVGPRVNPEPTFMLQWGIRGEVELNKNTYAFIMDNLEISFNTPVYRSCVNANEETVDIFIKLRSSTLLGYS